MDSHAARIPEQVTIHDLTGRYETFLLDAYGVLVDGAGALSHARQLMDDIQTGGGDVLIVTNDASRLPETVADRLQKFGLGVEPDKVITSGSLIKGYFDQHDLGGARCMVLGPDDSIAYVERAGGVVVPIDKDQDIDALIVCNSEGYSLLEGVEAALSAVARKVAADGRVPLILPNPDFIYPKGPGHYGFTSGALASLIEEGLARLFPDIPRAEITFARLGKPHGFIFDRARELARSESLIMVGDQLVTDIAGARDAGIASALIDSGLDRWQPDQSIQPDYLLTAPTPRSSTP